jgi:hypothetical protein
VNDAQVEATPEDGLSFGQLTSNARSSSVLGVSAPILFDRAKSWFAGAELGARRPAAKPDVASAELPLAAILSLFLLVFLFPAWPWLSGAVTIPWDAKSQFLPPLQFLSKSLATNQSPFWTPNVFAGWPLISDPQSLLFSPLHLLLAYFDRAPTFRAVDGLTFAYLSLGGIGIILYFRDRGWHAAGALVAGLTFALGGSANSRLQHTGEIIDLAYFALTLWMLGRALQQSSLLAGAAAGALGGLLAIGRDQVALVSLYVLFGSVVAHWIGSDDRQKCIRSSTRPLAAVFTVGGLVAAVPVIMTALLAARSNRPEIAWTVTGLGSLHPAHLLTLVFPDLYRAMAPSDLDYWGPGTWSWKAALGGGEIHLAKNMGLLYVGALPLVVTISLGVVRGLAWSRDIRFFSIAASFTLLYALGWYTPVFHVLYELLPGVTLFRRPADATFVLGVLLAIIAGYLVHRWLEDSVPQPTLTQHILELAVPIALVATALELAHVVVTARLAIIPVASAFAFTGGAVVTLFYARRLNALSSLASVLLLTVFAAGDLAWNNRPHSSTGQTAQVFDALRGDTKDETIALLNSKLAATTAPNRRDRVELTGIGYHWPNLCMIQGCEHVLGHNPLRLKPFNDATGAGDTVASFRDRHFSPLFPSYRSAFADLFGLRFIAVGVPVEEIDPTLRPGDLTFVAHTKNAYVYENPRALPRVMLMTDWRTAKFNELIGRGWPSDVDPSHTVLLKTAPVGLRGTMVAGGAGTARLTHYANAEVDVDVDAPSGGILVLNDVWHPWWRATVDGRPTEVLKANVIFRAVVVPAGKHMVRFTFHPLAGAFAELWARLLPVGVQH